MKKERLHFLLEVSNRRVATPEQQRELNAWYDSFEHEAGYTDQLSETDRLALRNRMLTEFEHEHVRTTWRQRRKYWSIAAAATIEVPRREE